MTSLVNKVDDLAAAVGADIAALSAGASPLDLDLVVELVNERNAETTATINTSATATSTSTTATAPTTNPIYGMNAETGALMSGDSHLWQSIKDILLTRPTTRVMLREYGSGIPESLDNPVNDTWIANLYISIAEALDKWEPRFTLQSIHAELGDYAGQPKITLSGEAAL